MHVKSDSTSDAHERRKDFLSDAFENDEAAARAGLPPVHPHMLRHSCGFSLANRGYELRLIQGSVAQVVILCR
jgi:integrase